MDHRYIEEHNIADHYLLEKLSEEERATFEEHFVNCDQCLDRLQETKNLRMGLQSLAAEDAALRSARFWTGLGVWSAWLNPRRQAMLLVGALVFLVGLPATFFVREIGRLRTELEQIKNRPSQQPVSRPSLTGQQQQDPGMELKDATDTKPGLAGQDLRGNTEAQQRGQDPTTQGDEINKLTQPQINTKVFVLAALRSAGRNRSRPTNEIIVSRHPEWFVFSIELEGRPPYLEYRGSILSADQRPVWSANGIKPDRSDTLAMTFNSVFFPAGDYLLVIEGLAQKRQPVPFAIYPFSIVKKLP